MASCSLKSASEASTPIFSASALGQSNFISPQSFSSESSRTSRLEEIKQNYVYLLVKRKRPVMKHCAVTLAMEEPVSDHNAPVCKVCHVNLLILLRV